MDGGAQVLNEFTDHLYELVVEGHFIIQAHLKLGISEIEAPALMKFKRELEKFLVTFLVAWELRNEDTEVHPPKLKARYKLPKESKLKNKLTNAFK